MPLFSIAILTTVGVSVFYVGSSFIYTLGSGILMLSMGALVSVLAFKLFVGLRAKT